MAEATRRLRLSEKIEVSVLYGLNTDSEFKKIGASSEKFPFYWSVAFDNDTELLRGVRNVLKKYSEEEIFVSDNSYGSRSILSFYFSNLDSIRPLLSTFKETRMFEVIVDLPPREKDISIYTLRDNIREIVKDAQRNKKSM